MTDIDLDKLVEQLERMAGNKQTLYGSIAVSQMALDAIIGLRGSAREAAAEIERLRSEASKMQARLDRWEPKPVANAGSFLTGGEARCNKHLAALGRPYPRTCLVCRLGPYRDEIVPHEANRPQPHKEED